MRPDPWHLTDDVDELLARAGDFLRSRPALHTTQLTVLEKMRTRGSGATIFGWLESGGVCYRRPSGRLTLTQLSAEQADTLAARLADLGHSLSAVTADHDTATAFAETWHRRTGAKPAASWWGRLHRLGTLTPPKPHPEGHGRVVADQEQVIRWCGEFADTVGETIDSWADSRFADKTYTFWETADGTPVSMAGSTALTGGMIRVDPVYTPAHLRGRGYAAAVTAEVSGAALATGATDVVLFTDPANPTSNALYRRLGYRPVAEFTGYDFRV